MARYRTSRAGVVAGLAVLVALLLLLGSFAVSAPGWLSAALAGVVACAMVAYAAESFRTGRRRSIEG